MTKTVSTKLMGGLGNYLFQIAAAYSVSLRDNKILICDSNDVLTVHQPYTKYLNNIFKKIEFKSNLNIQNIFNEISFNYNEIPKTDDDIKLIGYFQTEKYFSKYRSEILKLLSIDEETKIYLEKKYSEILKLNTCSLHIRRGDYLQKQKYHTVQSLDYYLKSLNEIGFDSYYLIFSDDIKWCKDNLTNVPNKIFIEGNEDYQDLYLMSMCKNNIIANSSFSWWGAWMNQNKNKKIIAPSIWFGDYNLHLDTSDLYCDKWVII